MDWQTREDLTDTSPLRRPVSRREAINYCLVGLASAACGGSMVWLLRNAMRPNPGGDRKSVV